MALPFHFLVLGGGVQVNLIFLHIYIISILIIVESGAFSQENCPQVVQTLQGKLNALICLNFTR